MKPNNTDNQTLELFRSYIGKESDEFTPPVIRWLKITITDVREGAVTLQVVVRPDMCNPVGLLHGGIQCTIMDEAIGMAVASLGSTNFHVNTNFSVDFLGKARAGQTVLAKALVVRAGKNMTNVQCELVHPDGSLIARSTSNLFRTEYPSFAASKFSKA
jgi:uncharacterized protein (TIGR00369 family)